MGGERENKRRKDGISERLIGQKNPTREAMEWQVMIWEKKATMVGWFLLQRTLEYYLRTFF
ncbi:hypothetical protein SLEP1_g7715 [Rubroshorea leprosula]|uniref:Uncharacterized protein n=1 Tax=Rubroshorea leprosula TaxID=152421 RepID=A0AAV5I8K3_9ROSI|nr:hypothetical protein SLEP1_g7715 [Rubroshorea leprosula]